MAIIPNPKLVGSGMIDCVPQVGPCPQGCDQCYYNKWFYAGHDPVMPSLEEAEGKIVRVNSGHDSNNHRGYVIEATRPYIDKFYNTAVPDLAFQGFPVMMTVNGLYTDSSFKAIEQGRRDQLMAVRFRADTWNKSLADSVVYYYAIQCHVPVIMTFMRYYEKEKVRVPDDYEFKLHLLHDYWDITHWAWQEFMYPYRDEELVFSCGTPRISLCKDCLVCEKLYWRFMKKHKPQRR